MTKDEWLIKLILNPGTKGTQGGKIKYWYNLGSFYSGYKHESLCNINFVAENRNFTIEGE